MTQDLEVLVRQNERLRTYLYLIQRAIDNDGPKHIVFNIQRILAAAKSDLE